VAIPTFLPISTDRVIKRNVGSREEKEDFSSGKNLFEGETRKGSEHQERTVNRGKEE